MREADAENRFGLTSFFHHFSNFLEAWHWPNKILQLAQGLGSYSSLRRTQKALGGRLGGAVGIGGDFFSFPNSTLVDILVDKNPSWSEGRGRGSLEDERFFIWKLLKFLVLGPKVFKKIPNGNVFGIEETKRPPRRRFENFAGRLRLPGRPRKSWNGRDRKRWCWCRWSCSWSRRPKIWGVVGTRLPQKRKFGGGAVSSLELP